MLIKNEPGRLSHAFSYRDASLPGNLPFAEIVDLSVQSLLFFPSRFS